MKDKKHCGRIGDHLSHYWRGGKVWTGKWVRQTYWCSGKVIVEGGHGVH